MKNEHNIETIVRFIEKLEIKYNTFDYKIADVYFWKLIRVPLMYDIITKLDLQSEAHPGEHIGIYSKIVDLVKKEVHRIKVNLRNEKINRETQILIFHSQRKVLYEEKKHDIYTIHLEQELSKIGINNFSCAELDFIDEGYHHDTSYKIIRPSYLNKIFRMIKFKKLILKKDGEYLSKLENDINSYFKIKVNLFNRVYNSIQSFKSTFRYYDKFFKKYNFRKIIIICSYGKEPIIAAAQKNNINVIELQHGTISDFHLGYNFPEHTFIPYFPNELLVFGEYWKNVANYPINTKLGIYGYPYLNESLIKYNSDNKIENTLIFLSQGTIAQELSSIAYEIAKKNPNLKIIYKLHPSEYKVWKEKYTILLSAITLKNFKVIDDNNIPLHKLLSQSDFQIGVNSTALFEGLALGCKTILVDCSGIEDVRKLVENKLVMCAKDAESLNYCLENYDVKLVTPDYFFKQSSDFQKLVSGLFLQKI